ncbi:hypothetical protein SAMN02745121_06154 [Nannocystis exedens]|uniref:Uncharacterized protein n=1 Tax=Nannocystis exedens TaxID=54 RepID=A0A1I2EP98_9BACT|nr:hypothetical protein NAEX_07015 [Nannocystis exedens]SFE94151.1 hypothetical protein SAMN02745121_06154 [Nannocystis exedens]
MAAGATHGAGVQTDGSGIEPDSGRREETAAMRGAIRVAPPRVFTVLLGFCPDCMHRGRPRRPLS